MPSVKIVDVPSDTYHDSVGAALHSTLEALQAKYGVVCLTNTENGSLRSYVSHGSLPSQVAGISVAHAVITNARKPAKSPRPEVEQSQEQDHLVIRVKDWGTGFICAE